MNQAMRVFHTGSSITRIHCFPAEHQPGQDRGSGGQDQVRDGDSERENDKNGGGSSDFLGSGQNLLVSPWP